MARESHILGTNIERFTMSSGKQLYVLACGNPINLAAGDGNPIEVMDLGLALHALSLEYNTKHRQKLPNEAQHVPYEVESAVARAALHAWT